MLTNAFSSLEPTIRLACVRNQELWEQPFQACAIDADHVKPDGQNSVISFVISKWLLPELSLSDHWSRRTKTLGRRLLTNVNMPSISKLLLPLFQNKSWCTTFHIKRIFFTCSLSCKSRLYNRTHSETSKKQLKNGFSYCVVPENIHATSMGRFFGVALPPIPTSVPLSAHYVFICFDHTFV